MAEKFLGICRYTPPPLRDGPARDLVAASPPVVGGPPRWILARLLPESPGDTGGSPLWRERVRGTASGGASSRSPAGGRRAKDLGAAARVWLCCLSGSQPAREIKEDQIKRPESSVTLADLVQASPRSALARTGLLHC